MDLVQCKVNLTNNQRSKIKLAFKKKVSVNIQFKIDQFNENGNDVLFLTKRQSNKLEKHKKLNKGFRIEFSYKQIEKSGGLLEDLLNFAENIPVVDNLVPYVRKAVPIAKKDIIPIVRNILDWLDNELNEVNGSGLDIKTLKYVKKNKK